MGPTCLARYCRVLSNVYLPSGHFVANLLCQVLYSTVYLLGGHWTVVGPTCLAMYCTRLYIYLVDSLWLTCPARYYILLYIYLLDSLWPTCLARYYTLLYIYLVDSLWPTCLARYCTPLYIHLVDSMGPTCLARYCTRLYIYLVDNLWPTCLARYCTLLYIYLVDSMGPTCLARYCTRLYITWCILEEPTRLKASPREKSEEKGQRQKVNFFMLKYERKQGNWTLEHFFERFFFGAFWDLFCHIGSGAKKCRFFKNRISKKYLITLKTKFVTPNYLC